MAKFPPDGTGPNRKGGASVPISSHRLFPAVVALWFAVLLGLGFAVLPASLLERITGLTGIAALIPAAAPPLGETARLAISAVAALAGAGLGFAIAKRVAASSTERVEAVETRRLRKTGPIAALSELGSESFDALPASAEVIPQETEPQAEEPDEFHSEELHPQADYPDEIEDATWIEPEPEFPITGGWRADDAEPAAEWGSDSLTPVGWVADESEDEPELGLAPEEAPERKEFSWEGEIQQNAASEPESADIAPQAWPEQIGDAYDEAQWALPEEQRVPEPAEQAFAPADDPLERLDQLGLAALTERLGRAMQAPRDLPDLPPELLARLKAAGAEPGPVKTALSEFPANAEEAVWPTEVHQSDIGLESFGEEEEAEEEGEWDEDDTPVLSTTLGAFRDYAREYTGGDDGEEEEEGEEEEVEQVGSTALYGSLLGMKISKRSAAAIDFDGSPVPDLEGFAPREIPPAGEGGPETERALRDALDTLKRIGDAG